MFSLVFLLMHHIRHTFLESSTPLIIQTESIDPYFHFLLVFGLKQFREIRLAWNPHHLPTRFWDRLQKVLWRPEDFSYTSRWWERRISKPDFQENFPLLFMFYPLRIDNGQFYNLKSYLRVQILVQFWCFWPFCNQEIWADLTTSIFRLPVLWGRNFKLV